MKKDFDRGIHSKMVEKVVIGKSKPTRVTGGSPISPISAMNTKLMQLKSKGKTK